MLATKPIDPSTLRINESGEENLETEKDIKEVKKTPYYAYPILVLCGASGAMDGPFS